MEKKRYPFHCKFCDWDFLSRIKDGPKQCPRCHNDWKKERKRFNEGLRKK